MIAPNSLDGVHIFFPDTGADGYAPKPNYRPLTKFENRGIKLGHGVWDVVFCKRAAS
jgi:tRNA G46 methylase TrmB